jgi:hypothetical protein
MENLLHIDVVPNPTLPPKYARPVVVAPPLIVRPSEPLPIVEDAYARSPPFKNEIPDTEIAVDDANGNIDASEEVAM